MDIEGLHLPQDVDPPHAGHREVDEEEVEFPLLEQIDSGLTVPDPDDLKAVQAEKIGEQTPDERFVVNDEYGVHP